MSGRQLRGAWRITWMEAWDKEVIDLLGRASIELDLRGSHGVLRFIAVEGSLDCRYAERAGRPLVEFSWCGFDDADPASGRGWATLSEDGLLRGRIFIHDGDESAFEAQRDEAARPGRKGRTRRRAR